MSSIISVDGLGNYMNKTLVSAQAAAAVDAVNTWIENTTGRCWGELRTVTETYDYKPGLYLRHQDVTSVTSIQLGYPSQVQTTLPPASYFANRFGRLTLIASMISPHTRGVDLTSTLLHDFMAVTYSYGVLAVPDDLTMAALGIAADFYNWAINGQKDIVSAGVGSYRLQYSGAVRAGSSGPDKATSTADALFSIVNSYRTRRV